MLRRSGGAGQQRRGVRRRRAPARARGQAGETLLELIIASALLGLAVVGIIGGVFTAITVSDLHREQTSAVTVLRSFAEELKSPDGTYAYRACDDPVVANRPPYPAYTPPAPHDDYVAQVVSIEYLQDATASTPVYAGCPASDQGAQRLTLRVESPPDAPRRASEEMVIVKRDARCDVGSTFTPC